MPWSREKKSFFQLATTVATTWSREKKFFFHLDTKITTPWSRKEKVFFIPPLSALKNNEKSCFSFIHYDQYAMTKSETFFFHLATTITTLWSREKKNFFSFSYYDHYAMIKREKSFFHLATLSNNKERKILFSIYSLWSLCHDQEWKFSFHLATIITTLWSREKKVFFI